MPDLLAWIQSHAELTFVILLTANAILTAFVILLENREPEKSIAWFLALLIFPLVGFIIYLFFGRDWHKRSYQQKRLAHALNTRRKKLGAGSEELIAHLPEPERSLRRLDAHLTGFETTTGNTVTILTDAKGKFPRLFAALRAAKKTIDIEYYIFRNDGTGSQVIEILKERARAGVKVRLLVDGTGSLGVGAARFRELRAAGVQCHYFAPLSTLLYFFKANYRDHRKIVVVDDAVAFTGGMNITDVYVKTKPPGPWRDTSVELRGPSALQLAEVFEDAWSRTTGSARRTHTNTEAQTDGELVDVVPSGPDGDWKVIHQQYLALIHGATKRIRIQTPYFIPDESLVGALTLAALRGVEVQLMLPQRMDWPYLRFVAHTYLEDILRAGGRVYEYRPRFLHTKVCIVDDAVASIGTCNVDIRSLRLDFEVNVLLSGSQSVGHLTQDFERDLKQCDEIHYASFIERPLRRRLLESVARLVSPLL